MIELKLFRGLHPNKPASKLMVSPLYGVRVRDYGTPNIAAKYLRH